MKKIIFLASVLLMSGCAQLRVGEVRDVQCRVLGLDASIPIPFAQSVNIMNVRLGWVETDYLHSYKVRRYSSAEQQIEWMGNAKRIYDYRMMKDDEHSGTVPELGTK